MVEISLSGNTKFHFKTFDQENGIYPSSHFTDERRSLNENTLEQLIFVYLNAYKLMKPKRVLGNIYVF